MKRQLLFLLTGLMVLTGCQKSTVVKEEKLYDGLNGKETYQAAVDYFNKNVNYYECSENNEGNITKTEKYEFNGKCSVVTKNMYQEDDFSYLNYTITSGNEFHSLFLNDELYEYELVDDYSQEVIDIYTDYNKDNSFEILDVKRVDQDHEIILNMKLKVSQIYQINDDETISYMMDKMTINKDGYIVKEEMTYYVDENFEEVLQSGVTIENSHFNEKTEKDFEAEIELMKSCDGLNNDEVKSELGL